MVVADSLAPTYEIIPIPNHVLYGIGHSYVSVKRDIRGKLYMQINQLPQRVCDPLDIFVGVYDIKTYHTLTLVLLSTSKVMCRHVEHNYRYHIDNVDKLS